MRAGGLGTKSSGILIVCLAAWGGIVAYVGPTFSFETHGATSAWVWNENHLTLDLAPALCAIVGGLMMILASSRALERLGALLALIAGLWFVVGPSLERLVQVKGVGPTTAIGASGTIVVRSLESIAYFYGTGALIITLAAFTLGMLAVSRQPAAAPAHAVPPTQDAPPEPTTEPQPVAPATAPPPVSGMAYRRASHA